MSKHVPLLREGGFDFVSSTLSIASELISDDEDAGARKSGGCGSARAMRESNEWEPHAWRSVKQWAGRITGAEGLVTGGVPDVSGFHQVAPRLQLSLLPL